MRDFLTARELAERWNMSIASLANQRYEDRGPHFEKRGWVVLYPLKDVVAYEKKNQIKPRVRGH